MTENLLAPEREITIDGASYTLNGSFKALKAIQQGFDCEILRFLVERVSGLSFDELARVIRMGIGEGAPTLEAIEQAIVEENGIMETRKLVGEWLLLAVTPKKDRQKKIADMEAATQASRGRNTRNSA